MPLSMDRWVNQVAVVTGASAGIGYAICKELVKAGLKVVGISRRNTSVEELSEALKGEKGKLYACKADITKDEELFRAFEFAKSLGPIHILINNAGRGFFGDRISDGDAKKWKEILDLNVLALSIATREAIKDMRKHSVDGHIIHINSIGGHGIKGSFGMYCPSKFAVTALTETLRQELVALGSKIKITSISPGAVETEFIDAAGGLVNETIREMLSNAPFLASEDIADAVLYVLSTPTHVQVHELMVKPVGETF